ncbi:MAG: calcium-binding protein, partial [Actinomycetota bacterium]
SGGPGNDYFRSGIGDDHYDGSDDMDTLDYSLSVKGIRADLAAGTTSTFGDQGSDTTTSIENLIGTTEVDEFTGDDGDNYFVGNGGVDELTGAGGDDVFEPLGGADIVDGGDGQDAVVYAAAPRPVTADLASGFANGHGADTLLGIEDLIGSRWPDLVRGSEDRNVFIGGEGGDILEGLTGDDYLDGQNGFDTLDGGDGVDQCVNGESMLDCEGSQPTSADADATKLQTRFTTFEALKLKWSETEQRMQEAPGFSVL